MKPKSKKAAKKNNNNNHTAKASPSVQQQSRQSAPQPSLSQQQQPQPQSQQQQQPQHHLSASNQAASAATATTTTNTTQTTQNGHGSSASNVSKGRAQQRQQESVSESTSTASSASLEEERKELQKKLASQIHLASLLDPEVLRATAESFKSILSDPAITGHLQQQYDDGPGPDYASLTPDQRQQHYQEYLKRRNDLTYALSTTASLEQRLEQQLRERLGKDHPGASAVAAAAAAAAMTSMETQFIGESDLDELDSTEGYEMEGDVATLAQLSARLDYRDPIQLISDSEDEDDDCDDDYGEPYFHDEVGDDEEPYDDEEYYATKAEREAFVRASQAIREREEKEASERARARIRLHLPEDDDYEDTLLHAQNGHHTATTEASGELFNNDYTTSQAILRELRREQVVFEENVRQLQQQLRKQGALLGQQDFKQVDSGGGGSSSSGGGSGVGGGGGDDMFEIQEQESVARAIRERRGSLTNSDDTLESPLLDYITDEEEDDDEEQQSPSEAAPSGKENGKAVVLAPQACSVCPKGDEAPLLCVEQYGNRYKPVIVNAIATALATIATFHTLDYEAKVALFKRAGAMRAEGDKEPFIPLPHFTEFLPKNARRNSPETTLATVFAPLSGISTREVLEQARRLDEKDQATAARADTSSKAQGGKSQKLIAPSKSQRSRAPTVPAMNSGKYSKSDVRLYPLPADAPWKFSRPSTAYLQPVGEFQEFQSAEGNSRQVLLHVWPPSKLDLPLLQKLEACCRDFQENDVVRGHPGDGFSNGWRPSWKKPLQTGVLRFGHWRVKAPPEIIDVDMFAPFQTPLTLDAGGGNVLGSTVNMHLLNNAGSHSSSHGPPGSEASTEASTQGRLLRLIRALQMVEKGIIARHLKYLFPTLYEKYHGLQFGTPRLFDAVATVALAMDVSPKLHHDHAHTKHGFCWIVACGDFVGGDLCIPELGKRVVMRPGTVVAIRSTVVAYYVERYAKNTSMYTMYAYTADNCWPPTE